MRSRNALLIVAFSMPVSAAAQPRTSDADLMSELGARRTYNYPAEVVIDGLRRALCTPGCEVFTDMLERPGHLLICRSAEAESHWVRRTFLFFIPEGRQTATPWARISTETTGNVTVTKVAIGVSLAVDGKPIDLSRLNSHFFKPSAWAQSVFTKLHHSLGRVRPAVRP